MFVYTCICVYSICACGCVHQCGVGWARTRILSRPTARIYSVLYYSNTGIYQRNDGRGDPHCVQTPFFSSNITARNILLCYIIVNMLKQTPLTTGIMVQHLYEWFCVCVFGYKERVMCGLWAVMEDPVSLMWWTLYFLYVINGIQSSTELSSVHPVFTSCRWTYKRKEKGILYCYSLHLFNKLFLLAPEWKLTDEKE